MPVIFLPLVLIALLGYLWGSIPMGYWIGKLLRGKSFDIRDYGSHKIGATNVQRTLGIWPAVIVFLFDLSKGLLPTLVGLSVPFFQADGWGAVVAGLAALLGHCFPIFIGFKGGRGVMTASGVILLLSPLTFGVCAVVAFATIGIWRYVSLGSIAGGLAAIICGIICYMVGLANPHFFAAVSPPRLFYLIVGPGLVILFHYDNIGRLLSGKERKIGQKVETDDTTRSARA